MWGLRGRAVPAVARETRGAVRRVPTRCACGSRRSGCVRGSQAATCRAAGRSRTPSTSPPLTPASCSSTRSSPATGLPRLCRRAPCPPPTHAPTAHSSTKRTLVLRMLPSYHLSRCPSFRHGSVHTVYQLCAAMHAVLAAPLAVHTFPAPHGSPFALACFSHRRMAPSRGVAVRRCTKAHVMIECSADSTRRGGGGGCSTHPLPRCCLSNATQSEAAVWHAAPHQRLYSGMFAGV